MDHCAFPGCTRPAHSRGYCSAHYQRALRTGFLLKLRRPPAKPKPVRIPRPTACTIQDCGGKPYGHGLCIKHWTRQYTHGSTDDPRPTAESRFWAKVDKSGPVPATRPDLGPCWLWTGKRNWMGYGNFWFERREWMAHRWAYHHLVAPISSDLETDHLCRVRACVNPTHLEPVSSRVNIRRGEGMAAKNARKTHCKRGHPFDAVNTGFIKSGTGGRYCKQCKHDANLVWFATHPHPQRPNR